MEIVLITFVFIALLLFIVWLPFFNKRKENTEQTETKQNLRDETNVVLYKEHKAEIEKDFSDGGIDEESYQYLLAELDKGFLQDIAATESKNNKPKNVKNFSVIVAYWVICIYHCFLSGFISATRDFRRINS